MTRQGLILGVLGLICLLGKGPLVTALDVQHRTSLARELNRFRPEAEAPTGLEASDDSSPADTGKKRKESEGHNGGQGLNSMDFDKERQRKAREPEESHQLELEEEFPGGSPRDEVVRIMEKLLSHPNLLPSPPAPPPVSNYANEKLPNPPPPPSVALHQHFLLPRERSVGDNGHGRQGFSDPLSTSLNQLLASIYEHQGMNGEAGAAPPLPNPINYPYTSRFYPKRSAPNSAYICHFKLCQFGSSGKRLYKPRSGLSFENQV